MGVKEEYESLNGKLRNEKYVYQSITIDDSAIDEVSIPEAIDIYHQSADSILYFGANWCPWCRSVLPILIKYAANNNLRITYINLDNKRPVYIKENDKIITKDAGDKDFNLLENEFKDIMQKYVLRNEDEEIELEDKLTIYIPLVVFGSFGKVLGYHYGGVELKEGQTAYDLFDDEQEKELLDIFENKNIIHGLTCDINGCSIK